MKKQIKEAIKLRIPNIPKFELDKICEDFETVENGLLFIIEDLMTHEGKYFITDSDIYSVSIVLFKLLLENQDMLVHCLIRKEGSNYYSIPVKDLVNAATAIRRGEKKL